MLRVDPTRSTHNGSVALEYFFGSEVPFEIEMITN